jgi:putative transcriptional regulator
MSSASSRHEKQIGATSDDTLIKRRRKHGRWYAIGSDGSERPLPERGHDWSRLDAMTEDEIAAAARSDPDAKPLASSKLKKMRRIPLAKHVRFKLGLTQEEFAARFEIPLGTLRDWEQRRREPDTAALAYLKVIAADPDFVSQAVKAKR